MERPGAPGERRGVLLIARVELRRRLRLGLAGGNRRGEGAGLRAHHRDLGLLAGWRGGEVLELEVEVRRERGAGWDQVAEDDVLLEADEHVDRSSQGGFGEDLGGLLEAGGADEGLALEAGL